MKPVNKLNFGAGPGTIKVSYHNGTTTVTGYIVKQLSATKWVVTTNGVAEFTCKLAKNGTPVAGEFTIQAFPLTNGTPGSAKKVVKMLGNHVTCTDGTRYMWSLGNPTGTGYAKLDVTT